MIVSAPPVRCLPSLLPCRVVLGLWLSWVGAVVGVVPPSLLPLAVAPAAAAEPARSSPAAKAAYTAAAALQNRSAWDLAAEAWEEMLRDHPRDPLAPKARYYLGLCRVEEGNWPAAERAFDEVVRAGDADAETAALSRFELGRGRFAVAQDRRAPEAYREAARALRGFLDSKPVPAREAEATYLLAECQWQAGDRDDAVGIWKRFVREHASSPRLAEVLYALGVAQAEDGAAAEAGASLRRFAEMFPDHPLAPEVAIRRADLALAAGEPVEAARLVVELAKDKQAPRGADALERLGTALWQQKRFAAAAAAFDMLAAREPAAAKSASALLSASAAWIEAGKPDEARTRLEQIVARGAGTSEAIEAAGRLGRLLLQSGDRDAALAVADQALQHGAPGGQVKEPREAGAIARLRLVRAEALFDMPGRREEALLALSALLVEHADDPVTAPALSLQAAGLLEAGRVAEALAATDRYLGLPKERQSDAAADVRAIRAEAILVGGDPVAAAEAWQSLIDESGAPERMSWLLRLGAAQVAARSWEAAHATLAPVTLAARGSSGLDEAEVAESLLLDATALVELGRPQEALPLLERIDRDHEGWSRRPEAKLLAVRARREAGDLTGALEVAERLVDGPLAGTLAERAWFRLGQTRQDAGQAAAAVVAYQEARARAPTGPYAAPSLLAEGACREAIDDLAGAEACWSELIERFPTSPSCVPALLARGDLRQRRGDAAGGLVDAEAVGALLAAGEVAGSPAAEGEARFLAGICHAAAGRPTVAADTFTALLAAHPDFPATDRVLLELGLARSAAGDGAAAEATFGDLRRRFPESPRIAEALLETGEIRFAAADWQAAADAYAELLEKQPAANAALVDQARHKLAWTFAMRQDPAAAVEAFRAQLAADPEGACAADGRVMLGDTLCRMGRFDEAKPVLAAALAMPAGISSADLLGLATVRAAECDAKQERWAESLALVDGWLAGRDAALAGAGREPAAPRTVAQARFARAWALQNLGRLEEALVEFRALAAEGLAAGESTGRGPTELAARARLMEGEVLFELERHKEAIAAFFKVAYGFGDREAPAAFHPWQAQATFEAARCFEVLGKPDQARGLYAEVVDRHPQGPHVAAARKRLDALSPAPK